MKRKLLLSSLIFIIGSAWATVPASVDRSEVGLGQSFTLTINLPSSSDTPDLEGLKNNFEVFGTSSNSQTSIINGKINSEHSLIVTLAAKNTGKQVIPAIKIGNDTTSPITINVISGGDKQVAGAKNNDIYLDSSVVKQAMYVGVPFLYSVKLYYRVSLNNVAMEPLALNGAQVQPQGKSTQYQAKLNGNNYQVVEQQFLITPSRAGTLTIPAAKISGSTVGNNTADPFMMMRGGKPFMVTSKPVSATIKDIPKNIAPNEWLPAKQLKVTDDWSIKSEGINIGDPITHTINLEALGIPNSAIPELHFDTPNGVNAYPDKSQGNTTANGSDMVGTKTFKIAYIPTKSGEVTFPEMKIKWWDLTSDSLKVATIPAKSFKVAADSQSSTFSSSIASRQNNTASAEIRETKLDESVAKHDGVNFIWQVMTFIFAGLWGATLIVVYRLYATLRKNKRATSGGAVYEQDNFNTDPHRTNKQSIAGNSANLIVADASIKKACQEKNINLLNNALLAWASKYSAKKLYSIGDIKEIFSDIELNNLINKLSAALYNGQEFSQFEELQLAISRITPKQSLSKQANALRGFYPE